MQDGRLGGPPNEVNLRHAVEPYLRSELAEIRSFVAVDMAHTIMLAEQGILTTEQAGSILASLQEIDSLGPESFPTEPEYGSLLPQIERFIAERAGEDVAGRMHTGRSRNDQSAAVSRLVSRDRLIEVLDALLRLQVAVLSLAREHLDTYMPGYTHLQHAQPTTLAHYLMRHWFTFERDQQRLEGAFDRTNLSSLGVPRWRVPRGVWTERECQSCWVMSGPSRTLTTPAYSLGTIPRRMLQLCRSW